MSPVYRGWQTPGYAFDKRAADRSRSAAQRAGQWDQLGTVMLATPTTGTAPVVGEGSTSVTFQYMFTKRPVFTFGHELGVNETAVPGSFPTFSATVLRWTMLTGVPGMFWVGAVIAFVVGGSVNQQSVMHYSFRGDAMIPFTAAYNDTGSA